MKSLLGNANFIEYIFFVFSQLQIKNNKNKYFEEILILFYNEMPDNLRGGSELSFPSQRRTQNSVENLR